MRWRSTLWERKSSFISARDRLTLELKKTQFSTKTVHTQMSTSQTWCKKEDATHLESELQPVKGLLSQKHQRVLRKLTCLNLFNANPWNSKIDQQLQSSKSWKRKRQKVIWWTLQLELMTFKMLRSLDTFCFQTTLASVTTLAIPCCWVFSTRTWCVRVWSQSWRKY